MLKRVLLICPSERDPVRLLGGFTPLASLPVLGQSLLEYWLGHFAENGVSEAIVLAHDRPEQIRKTAGAGERWGLSIEVISESRELTPAQALLKYGHQLQTDTAQNPITLLDHFPGLPQLNLYSSYAAFWSGLLQWFPKARTPDTVGVRELSPGVHAAVHSRISPAARLRGPCWLGHNVIVSAGATIGPAAVIEDNSFIDRGADIAHTYIAPDTFVGRHACLSHSLALGDTLINWQKGSAAIVPDAFLLCAMHSRARLSASGGLLARVAEFWARKAEALVPGKQLVTNKEG
jgi:NDP-sugar pyrophosphorylase family protein